MRLKVVKKYGLFDLASGGVGLRTVRRKRAKYQLIDYTTIYTTTYNGDGEKCHQIVRGAEGHPPGARRERRRQRR